MSAKARQQNAVRCLTILAALGFVTVCAAVNADATSDDRVAVAAVRDSVADLGLRPSLAPDAELKPAAIASKQFVIALATPAASTPASNPPPVSAIPPAANIAPLISALPPPAPAHFFTINEVMANSRAQQTSSIHLASTNPTGTETDAGGGASAGHTKSDEPFGLSTSLAPDGQLWTKWRKVAEEIRVEEPALTRCLAAPKQCSPAATRFSVIVNEARSQNGRARLDLVNQRVNNAIHYKSDMTQWGVADVWSPPLAANDNGSFDTGFGDCEDYAIAKYVALRAAGVPARQLRVMLVRDNIARVDHAVLAALDDGHWFILDNRWTTAVEDTEVRQFTFLFALDDEGVKLLAVPYAAKIQPMSEVVKSGKQKFVPGGDSADQAPIPAPSGITAIGLRGPVL